MIGCLVMCFFNIKSIRKHLFNLRVICFSSQLKHPIKGTGNVSHGNNFNKSFSYPFLRKLLSEVTLLAQQGTVHSICGMKMLAGKQYEPLWHWLPRITKHKQTTTLLTFSVCSVLSNVALKLGPLLSACKL